MLCMSEGTPPFTRSHAFSQYACSLGLARFLKTVKCRHKNGYLVVKIFIKPDPGLSLRKYHRRLKSKL